jgi:hypothetical protein
MPVVYVAIMLLVAVARSADAGPQARISRSEAAINASSGDMCTNGMPAFNGVDCGDGWYCELGYKCCEDSFEKWCCSAYSNLQCGPSSEQQCMSSTTGPGVTAEDGNPCGSGTVCEGDAENCCSQEWCCQNGCGTGYYNCTPGFGPSEPQMGMACGSGTVCDVSPENAICCTGDGSPYCCAEPYNACNREYGNCLNIVYSPGTSASPGVACGDNTECYSGDTCCQVEGIHFCCGGGETCATSTPDYCVPFGSKECPSSGGDPMCCEEDDICCGFDNCCPSSENCCPDGSCAYGDCPTTTATSSPHQSNNSSPKQARTRRRISFRR